MLFELVPSVFIAYILLTKKKKGIHNYIYIVSNVEFVSSRIGSYHSHSIISSIEGNAQPLTSMNVPEEQDEEFGEHL